MTLEELVACDNTAKKMQTVSEAVEQLLVAAQRQDCLTVGVYESAKLMNVDPDSVVLCLLAIDQEDEDDIALQIHFTLIQAFCCDNDIDILRVSGMQRLAQVLGESAQDNSEPRDLHCILVTVSCEGDREGVMQRPANHAAARCRTLSCSAGLAWCSRADYWLKLAAT
ncbi:growth arrest and DNA damage-inducible protein GADD45 beta isoform X1 [Emydura macquarii macquarii]|uniref:growth arrest and DNA damage-inducible protein GADD45 beta isoform X1 n=1 Tax=Emydura macquarii macquarii TaxID=1129001 RepID=UPI00352A1C28